MPGTDGAFLSSQTRSECAGLFTKSRRTDPLAHFARVSPSARGRMTQQNERLYSPPRRGGEPPGAQRGGRGSVRRLFVQSPAGEGTRPYSFCLPSIPFRGNFTPQKRALKGIWRKG